MYAIRHRYMSLKVDVSRSKLIYVIFEFVLLSITIIYLTKHRCILSAKNPHNLQRRRVFISVIASGNIQCAYSVKENSFRGLLLTPRTKATPSKCINIIYEFCLARQRHDV